jgi:hypothetical protein
VWLAYVGSPSAPEVAAALEDRAQPRVVIKLDALPLTDGFRPKKAGLPRSLQDARITDAVKR